MARNTILHTIEIESQASAIPRWSDQLQRFHTDAQRAPHHRIINLAVFRPEQQQFIRDLTGGEARCTLMLEGRPHYAPELHPADTVRWMRFFEDYADRKAAWLQAQQALRDRIDGLVTLSDEELLPHHEFIHPSLGRTLEEAYQAKGRGVVERFRKFLLTQAEKISVQNRKWALQHGSPELQAAVKQLPEDALLFDFWVHFWKAHVLLMDDPRMAHWEVVDTFLYEFVHKTFPGAFLSYGALDTQPITGAPDELQEQAGILGGTLARHEDHEMYFPEHLASEEAAFQPSGLVVQVPWGYRWLVYPVQVQSSLR
ncbi:hypothetical protein [Deinococcus cellulosilyticus]|nr:hypothetical protein [Deinococcus cellulosilyticus]